MAEKIDLARAARRLRQFFRERQRPPSFEEIRDLFGYKSKNAAFWLVKKLSENGLLRKDAKGKLCLAGGGGLRLLGSVQAGLPDQAEEEHLETLNLDDYLVKNPEQSFLVKVTGDSMIDAGIREGDLVVVERGRQPRDGDIVIAQIDGSWTMKYYRKTRTETVLLAANRKFQPMRPKTELVVGGVVTAVIRKYR